MQMSSVVERDISHVKSIHSAALGSQRRVTSKSTEYLTDRMIPQSKNRFCAVNYATSMVKDKRMEHKGKVIALYPRTSMMLQNINIKSLSYD